MSPVFKNELVANQGALEQMYNLQPGQSLVTFNGYILSQDLDMYEILDLARREMAVMTRLHDFGLQVRLISFDFWVSMNMKGSRYAYSSLFGF